MAPKNFLGMKNFFFLTTLCVLSSYLSLWSQDKSVLFIAGDTKHRHGFHEYKAGSILLADALNASGRARR